MNNPALYAAANGITRRHVSDIADEFSEEIGKMSGRCIDIGTGPGDVTVDFILPKLNPEATLVCSDVLEGMVEFAKERYMDNERLSFIKLDIDTPNLPEDMVEQFDHVTSIYCFHWCENIRQVFKNIYDLLRPGGTTFVIFIAKYSGVNCYKELAAMPQYQPYMKDVDRYIPGFQHCDRPRQELKTIIKDTGFQIYHCSVRENIYTFDSLDDLSDLAQSINPFMIRMPADIVEEYKKDLLRGHARHNIVLPKSNKNEDECSILCIYSTFIVYLKKPEIKS